MSDYLPVQLSYGEVCIYKVHRRSSIHNIKTPMQPPKAFNWGTIYQISPYGIPAYVNVGQSVLYDGRAQVCILAYAGHNYPIIPYCKIAATET